MTGNQHGHHLRRGAVRRYVSLNAHGCLICSLERSGHIGHGYESSKACGDGGIDEKEIDKSGFVRMSNYEHNYQKNGNRR